MDQVQNVFNRVARKSDDFSFRKGNTTTFQIWTRPSYGKILAFLRDVEDCTDILERYRVFLIGGCLYSWEATWDVDLHLVSKDVDTLALELDLDFLNNLSLNKYNQLLDVTWTNVEHPSSIICSPDNCGEIFSGCRIIKTRIIEKRINTESARIDLAENPKYKLLSDNLVETIGTVPGPKIISRMSYNIGKKLVLSMPVKDMLCNNEDFFIENSNHNKVR